MKEKIISEINLDLVFKFNEFSQFSNNLKDSKNKLIFESIFWEKVFLSWTKIILKKDDYKLPNFIFEKKSFSLGLQIISNQEIAFMNQKWMQKNGPTDVLSFPIISDESLNNLDHIELGDIFISLEMALEQSHEYKNSIYKEMLWLASHGFLHLFGWEHKNNLDLENMLNFQEYLIKQLD
ncbi:rRNA maturation RNase YbeY [Prochlorococcus marinus XMU1419]|uniref:rRNA maturation RNase YbeY n=1 Tax=Prochlorococcus marinus TaxID=1219 RepID=UPI001ADC4446|nr:rRNA maturation RNase YbeY [Prochlorococcus marinus]MBO8233085.1 rRNA maturation RNase YbeY [Prochlorococcus marinus XMU1419]MBW3076571.1 rRNA maturation RNase YbeY [Prochlorococcus marinus str. XMU1419]